MATYYSNSNNQRDAATMLYLREQLPSSYSEAMVLPGNMMMYMNYSSSSGSYSDALAANSQQQNNCIEMPSSSTEPQREILSNLGGTRIGEHDFNAWRDGRNEMLLMHHQMGGSSSANILQSGQNLQGQGLSLSLGTQIPSGMQMPSIQFRNPNLGLSSFLGPNPSISGDDNSLDRQLKNAEYFPNGFQGGNQDPVKADPSPYGMSSIARAISNSKYLKAAQQLLDEVANVRKALKQPDSEKNKRKHEHRMKDSKNNDGSKNEAATEDPSTHQDSTGTSSSELSPSERLELQNKMTKLLSMLDEVDRRYKQYYHQMQIVVSSFDVVAGCGAAKPYTALALQTISRHFRCLRDAITDQIGATQKSLGEQDTSFNSKGVGISRLRYVDQQLKQQRALQQFGMMQQHTWRPQRGLPESAVSVLRAWLFEHFLHPYPKDSDKIMLARQAGLTRSQVSNWFINARVRLWKPMVEEMYKEEAGDADIDSNSSSENAPKARKGVIRASGDRGEDFQRSPTSTATEKCSTGRFINSTSHHVPEIEMEGTPGEDTFQNETRGENETDYGIVKFRGEQRPSVDDCSLFNSGIVQSDGDGDRFMAAAAAAIHMSELERFGSGGGVSLTLGLQHFEGGNLPMAVGTHHGFVNVRGGHIYNPASSLVEPETADFDCMDPGNRQRRFSSSHLLHDFVA